ncbi:MAG: hypothetical protein WC054_07540 [Candidatus Nanopelagicales bacterium]
MTQSSVGLSRRVALVAVSCALTVGVLGEAFPALAAPAADEPSVSSPALNAELRAAAPASRSGSKAFAKTDAGPDGITVDAMGNVYTANSRANTVTKVTASGKASRLGATGKTPRGIAVDSSGNVYTSNLGDNTVTKITPGGSSSVLGNTGSKPIDVAVDSAGNVYTTNYADSTVTKITPAGVSSVHAATGSRPLGITLDRQGNVYTANEGANSVTKITPGGAASTLGKTGSWPQAIAIDRSGNIYTANWNSRNVSKITPKGKSAIYGKTGRRPIGIVVDPRGAVFTTNDGANSVSKINRKGRSKVIASTGRRPIGIASDAAGFLYTANFLSNTITEVYPSPKGSPSVITLNTVSVLSPGNRKAWIIPFWNDVYASKAECLAAFPAVRAIIDENADPAVQAASSTNCMGVGKVPYKYQIAETELTVAQWVTFLNTVDPKGRNKHRLWDAAQSSRVWPKYGSINRNKRAPRGQHYYVASPEWANKPYNVADFTRAARLANSINNGKVIQRKSRLIKTTKGKRLLRTTFKIRLSTKTESGMYKMGNRKATRTSKKGFAVSSQDEWIKAAYFDPRGGGKHSYWDYPTNPGVYVNCPVDESGCAEGKQPSATQLDGSGNVINSGTQPLASFEAVPGVAPDWCPAQFSAEQCAFTPFEPLENIYVGNMSSVGQALTRSPWGTLDQGGNVVEVTDTISPPPPLGDPKIVWRRWHGGVVTATAYQMWLSAVGVTPQTVPGYAVNPWRGIRLTARGLTNVGK